MLTDAMTDAAYLRGREDAAEALNNREPGGPTPEPDLSGEWADSITPRTLCAIVGLDPDTAEDWELDEICQQYESGFDRELEDAGL